MACGCGGKCKMKGKMGKVMKKVDELAEYKSAHYAKKAKSGAR